MKSSFGRRNRNSPLVSIFTLRVKSDLKHAAPGHEVKAVSFLCTGLQAKKITNILIKICFTKANARVVTSPFLFFLQVRVYS